MASVDLLFSKDMAVSVGLAAGALVEPISGLTGLAVTLRALGIAPLLGAHLKYRKARREIMHRHDFSWLYLTKERLIPVK